MPARAVPVTVRAVPARVDAGGVVLLQLRGAPGAGHPVTFELRYPFRRSQRWRQTTNAHGTAHVTVVLMDDGGTANGGVDASSPQTFDIVISKPHIWHNTKNPLDVNDDGHVAPNDAVAVINYDVNASPAASTPQNNAAAVAAQNPGAGCDTNEAPIFRGQRPLHY